MRYFFFFILLSFSFDAFSDEKPSQEEQAAACAAAMDTARATLDRDIARHAATIANTPPAVDAASGQSITTGNPVTDAYASLSKAQSSLAEAQQQKLQAQSQIDNECFQQFEDISDKCHDIRQKEYERLRQINTAEGEKVKQESEVRLACWKESSALYQGEITRLNDYTQRTVSTVSGATRSKQDVNQLRSRFYNQCMSSPATQEALLSCKGDLDVKMRSLDLMATEFASDLEYHENTKMTRMSDHCKLRQDQVDAQYAPIRNAAIQGMIMSALAVKMATQTAAASAEGQAQVVNSYGSLNQVLNSWANIKERCGNMHISSGRVDAVPADAYEVMKPIHAACRPPEMSPTVQCFTSTGTLSTDQQGATRATSSK